MLRCAAHAQMAYGRSVVLRTRRAQGMGCFAGMESVARVERFARMGS